MRRRSTALGIFLSLIAFSADASRLAEVDIDDVEIREGPSTHSRVIGKLKKNEKVLASNQPTEGFYKIKTIEGDLGWVPADTLLLQPIPIEKPKDKGKSNQPGTQTSNSNSSDKPRE